MVAMEFAYDLRADAHAGTPPLTVVRVLISRAASKGQKRGEEAEQLSVYDVTCAFLHAQMDENIFVRLPEGLAPRGFKAGSGLGR